MTTLSPSSYGRRSGGGFLPVLVALVVGLLVGAAGGWWVGHSSGTSSSASPTPSVSCPPLASLTVVALPAAKTITVNVYNATTRGGLARTTADLLVQRGFLIGAIANDPKNAAVAGSAEVRYGPKGALNAKVVAAQVQGAALVNDGRTTTTVDFVVGRAFHCARHARAGGREPQADARELPVRLPHPLPGRQHDGEGDREPQQVVAGRGRSLRTRGCPGWSRYLSR